VGGRLTTSSSDPWAAAARPLIARVALVNEGDLDHLARRRLHLSGQFLNRARSCCGRRDEQGKQMSQRIHRDVTLLPFFRLAPS
jgi:hypothetical protein